MANEKITFEEFLGAADPEHRGFVGQLNQLLQNDGHLIPPEMINIPQAANYTVEELYEKLITKHFQ